jgi:serine/threonine-protein kinase
MYEFLRRRGRVIVWTDHMEAEKQRSFPERLGRYEVLLPIASGGMATVYLARSRGAGGFERDVALKLMHPHLRREASFLRDLFEEARTASRIRHPNVVPVIDVGDDPAGVFLVMDYVEGDTLGGLHSRVFSEGADLPLRVGIRILLDAVAGLHAAHELCDDAGKPLGVIHRDFSPQNILVGTDGIGKLTDFGIAKAASRLDHTQTGVIKGKVSYMAPEQAKGKTIDRRVDVWAAGVVAWQLIAGRRIHESDNELATLLKVATVVPPLLREVAPSVSPAVEQVIARALTLDPADRWPTAKAFRQALTEAWRATEPVGEPEEVAECVARLVGAKLAERRARVTEIDSARARAQAPTLGEELDLVPVESQPRAQPPPAVATPAQATGSRPATDSATSEYVHVPRDTIAEAQSAPPSAQSVPVAAPLDAEPTRTDTTSVSSAKVLVPPSAPWMTPRRILLGSLAPVLLAVVLAFLFSRARPEQEGETVAAEGASAVADPSRAGTAGSTANGADNPAPGPSATAAGPTGAVLATTGSPPVAARRAQVSVRANASMVSVRVGNRPVEPPHPGREVLVDLAADEGSRPLRIEATSTDGRHAGATLPPGEASVQLSFAAAATIQHSPAPPPPRPPPQKPAVAGGPPPLAPIPYGQGR